MFMKIKINILKNNELGKGYTPFQAWHEKGMASGCFDHEEDLIQIKYIVCNNFMKEIVEELIKKFKTNKILFYNIQSGFLSSKLNNYRSITIIHPMSNEKVKCFQVEWLANAPQSEIKNLSPSGRALP